MKERILNKEEPLSSQNPKKVIYVEMFRAGPQISSTGQKMVFTESDLEQVISTYKPESHEAPLIIGHDQDDGTPALGWVKDVWRKGKELWGKVELTPKAEKLIRDGVFKKVSSSFYLPDADTNPTPGKLALRHLGLVSIPAVKGLSAFSEQIGEEKIFTSTPSEGESSISFKENLETDTVMARKRTKKETPVSVSEYTEGGMTVNINIGKEGGPTAPNVYDDDGNQISETGAPADYEMDYAADEEMPEEGTDAPEAAADEESSDDLGLEDEGGEEEMPSEEGEEGGEEEMPSEEGGEEEMPSEEPSMETEDVSDDMEDGDKKVASLAAEYTEDELFNALSLKKKAASMMEGGSDSMSSYGEMPEGLKKHMEERGDDGEEKKEDEDEEKKTEDMGEETAPSADDETEVSDNGEGCSKDYEEDKEEEEEDEEKKKSDMSEKEAPSEATGTLDHSEEAMGVQGNKLETRVAELEEELARHKKMIREKEISDFCEGVYGSGKLTEQIVSKTDLVRFMETLNSKNTVNFSESGKASQFDFFKGVLESLPSMVSFEELATPASEPKKSAKQVAPSADGYIYDPSTADLHAQALEYSEEKGCDYLTAVKDLISHS
jgi:hypothetical protein